MEQDHSFCLVEGWVTQADVDAYQQTDDWKMIIREMTKRLGVRGQVQFYYDTQIPLGDPQWKGSEGTPSSPITHDELEKRKRTFQQRCDEILQYLKTHPDGGDTAEGIVEWWLAGHDTNEGEMLVEEALNHLTEQGLLERHVLVEGTILYEPAPPSQ